MPIVQRATSFWLRLTEPLLLRSEGHVATAKALRAARIARFPEWYLAISYLASGLTGLVVGASAYVVGATLLGLPARWSWGAAAVAAVFAFLLVRLGFLAYPRVVAAGRARRIDAELPSVVTLCYALSRGGMNPLDIFREVARERSTYGEAAIECGVVVRNVEWFGMDFVTALKETSATTPSADFRSLLDGFVTILNSGADPRDYFKNQAHTRLQQAELGLERELEQASLLAEIYVSGLLVLPLLLLVVLAGLAPLAPGQDALMPFVVFGLVPLGTGVYLVLLETMLPPESLAVPAQAKPSIADFGIASLPNRTPLLPPPWRAGGEVANLSSGAAADGKAARSLHWRLFLDRLRQGAVSRMGRARDRMTANPQDALAISGFLGLAFTAGAGVWVNARGVPGIDRAYALTGVLLLGIAITAVPVSIFHEVRLRSMRKVERALPDTLKKLASFNERGISLLQSFQILGRSTTGPLAHELKAVDRDVTWNSSLQGALQRLRQRVRTARMAKLGILLERASAATGNLREVLDIAAEDATRTEHLKATKHQSMMSYVVVVYLVFAVFLYVLYVVADLFYGPTGLGTAAAAGATGSGVGIQPEAAKLLFAQASVIQGVACGLVAGRLGEGHFLSGLKHAVILGIAAYFVFLLGVL